ncbi:MAG: NepR family anti-sigma factor [Pseudomonadota bacterium]
MSDKIDGDKGNHIPKPSRSAQIAMAREIEENLKRVYKASLTEEVPDRFLQLLADLKNRETKS